MTSAPAEQTLILGNARIVLPDRVVEHGAVVIEDGRVAGILERESSQTESKAEIDLAGCTLFPGFIDAHIHGAIGVDVMNANAGDLQQLSQFLSSQGVCGWLPTLVPAADENYAAVVRAIEQTMISQSSAESRVLGLHYEGPFVNSAQCGALHGEYFKTFSGPADIDALPIPEVRGAKKMITLAPEIDGGLELVRELNRRGWIISIGHTRADVEMLDRVYEAGARHMTHFMNAMAPLHHRRAGPIGWGLSRDDVTCDIIADGIHLDPLILRLLLKVKSPERLALISDAIAATGLGAGDYQIWGETISVSEGRTSNARGSIAGSVITMLDALRLMLNLGVDETDVARMASTNPARLLDLSHECGSIAAGKRADLVALDSSGNVKLTLVGGHVAFRGA